MASVTPTEGFGPVKQQYDVSWCVMTSLQVILGKLLSCSFYSAYWFQFPFPVLAGLLLFLFSLSSVEFRRPEYITDTVQNKHTDSFISLIIGVSQEVKGSSDCVWSPVRLYLYFTNLTSVFFWRKFCFGTLILSYLELLSWDLQSFCHADIESGNLNFYRAPLMLFPAPLYHVWL